MPTRKPAQKKMSGGKQAAVPPKTGARRAASPACARKSAAAGRSTKLDKRKMRALLLDLRNRVTGQISFLSDDANHKDDTPTDDRTDEFDREFAFNLVSAEQDALFEIDDALRRIELKTYGKCECCGGSIEAARLQALPFARNCVKCQSDIESGAVSGAVSHRSRFREPEYASEYTEEASDA